MKNLVLTFILITVTFSCNSVKEKNNSETTNPKGENSQTVASVNADDFKAANPNTELKIVDCTLSDGTKTKCYEITTNSTPTDHQMGPWCPETITDGKDAGGIWLSEGKVYDVDGVFVENLAAFYNDNTWKMYDGNGNIYVTSTKEDCINAANPNVGEEYINFCVECLPSYITDVSQTWTIPITPVSQVTAKMFQGPRGGGKPPKGNDRPDKGNRPPKGERPERGGKPEHRQGGIPATRGLALNGVEFSAPAPVNNILSAYTLAPFDDAGGHINVHQGYHYHTATGVSFSVNQEDGHAPLIGYAIDGYGIYARLDNEGNLPGDLDDCRGQYDDIRGYHYHVDDAGKNNFINCLKGAYAN